MDELVAWGWTLLAFLFMIIGALITAFMYGFWQVVDKKRIGETILMKQFVIKKHTDKVVANKKSQKVKKEHNHRHITKN